MATGNAVSNSAESGIMKLIFQAVSFTNYATSTGMTNTGVSLHTADPGEAGTAATSEVTYTSYTRVNVARSAGGWNESGGVISPVANIDFPAGTGGSGTVTFFATADSNASPPTGAQPILFYGAVSPSIVTGSGVTPRLTTATTIALD